MELLTYMFNLDTHKNGVQQILQGFETGDNISRRLVMALTEETEPVFLPQSGVTATMYTKRPAQSSPSLYSVEISGNNIIFDVPSDVLIEAGMVDMQLKLTFGANDNQMIMNAPRFQLEVWESLAQDSEAEDSQEYESLQQALARANAVYNGRITSFSFDENFVLTVQYGWDEEEETRVIYTTDIFAEAMENFTEALSEHYPTIQIGTVSEGNVTSVTNVGTEEHAIFNFVLQNGIQGEPGEDGYSPSASVTKVGNTATITITDESGTTTAEVSDGTDGSTVSWNQIAQSGTKIAEVTIDGTKYNVYAPNTGTVVGWNQIVTSGTKIATISINGTPVDVYAPTSGGGGATTLSGLDDVNIDNPASGEVLVFDGSDWVNSDIPTPTVRLDEVEDPTDNVEFTFPPSKELHINGGFQVSDFNSGYTFDIEDFSVIREVNHNVQELLKFEPSRSAWAIGGISDSGKNNDIYVTDRHNNRHFLSQKANIPIVLQETLAASDTGITISSSSITSSSRVEIFTDKSGLNPTIVVVSPGSIFILFPAQSTSTTVRVYVYDY